MTCTGGICYSGNIGIGNASTTALDRLSIGYGINNDIGLGTSTNNRAFFGTFGDAFAITMNRRVSDGFWADQTKAEAEMSIWVGAGDSRITFATSAASYTTASERVRIDKNGNVGIGTTTPLAPLHVAGPAGTYAAIFQTPGSPLAVVRDTSVTANLGLGVAGGPGAWLNGAVAKDGLVFSDTGGLGLGTGANVRLYVNSAGNVGIGTTTPQHLLHVAGAIGATEVVVSSTGADYVFDPGYRLAPLSEIGEYIKKNHHLPDIPSAAEMQQKGAGLGDMQAKLLAKIEELTLHMIQAEKENRELRARIARLESRPAMGRHTVSANAEKK